MEDSDQNDGLDEKVYYFFFRGLEDEIHCLRLFDGMLFGRRDDCDVVIEDDLISGQHFQVHVNGRHVYVEDLDSVNKTFINDEFIQGLRKTKLFIGDIIRVGSEIYGFSDTKILSFNLPKRPENTRITVSNIAAVPSGIRLDTSGKHLKTKSDSKKLLSQIAECKKKIKTYEDEKQSFIDSRSLMREYKSDLEDLEILKKQILKEFPSINEAQIKEVKTMLDSHEQTIISMKEEIKTSEDEIDRLHQLIEDNTQKIKDGIKKKENMQYEMGVYGRYSDLMSSIEKIEESMKVMANPAPKIKELEQLIREEKSNHKSLQKEYGEAVVQTADVRAQKKPR
jgi:pSer/pThr/pTyr-binding forkhead associated (FHA) protein